MYKRKIESFFIVGFVIEIEHLFFLRHLCFRT